jgi:hypothetical protein
MTQAEEIAIHHIDSTLGLLLAVSTFLAGVLPDIYVRSGALEAAAVATFQRNLGIFLVAALLTWIIGVLRSAWGPKLLAWFLTMYVLLSLSFYLCLSMWEVAPFYVLKRFNFTIILVLPKVLSSFVDLLSVCGASVLLWFGVRYAYRRRLSEVNSWHAHQKEIDYDSRWIGVIATGAFLIWALLVFLGIT